MRYTGGTFRFRANIIAAHRDVVLTQRENEFRRNDAPRTRRVISRNGLFRIVHSLAPNGHQNSRFARNSRQRCESPIEPEEFRDSVICAIYVALIAPAPPPCDY